jgi:hypothetical protein
MLEPDEEDVLALALLLFLGAGSLVIVHGIVWLLQ